MVDTSTLPFILNEEDLRTLQEIFKDNGDAMARAVRRVADTGEILSSFNSFIDGSN